MASETEDGGLTIDSIESTESVLRSNDISFKTIRHPAALTVEEMVQHRTQYISLADTRLRESQFRYLR